MINISVLRNNVTKAFGRGYLLTQKHSPEILMGAGIVGVIATAVLASKATLKAVELIDETKATLDLINEAGQKGKTRAGRKFSNEDHQRDLAVAYIQSGVKFAKLYAPAVGVGVLSISCLLGAHGIMKRRNVALVAAYNLVNEGFQNYRKRVVEELGEETDRNFRLGLRETKVTETVTDEEGKKAKVKKTITICDADMPSPYARFFDEASSQWRTDPSLNLYFLRAQQNYINDELKSRGHVFLNEVYDAIGIPRSKAGSVVGWVYDPDTNESGDNFIDFGIYNPDSTPGRDFVNGYNRSILLDFNVDGVIYDLI